MASTPRRPLRVGAAALTLVFLLATVPTPTVDRAHAADATMDLVTEIGKGAGNCAQAKAADCIGFVMAVISGGLGKPDPASQILDKLNTVVTKLDAVSQQLTQMSTALTALGVQLNERFDNLDYNNRMTTLTERINDINNGFVSLNYAQKACADAYTARAAHPAAAGLLDKETTCQTLIDQTVALIGDKVFPYKDDLHNQMAGVNLSTSFTRLLFSLYATKQGPIINGDVYDAAKARFDYYAHVQAMQLILVREYRTKKYGIDGQLGQQAQNDNRADLAAFTTNLGLQQAQLRWAAPRYRPYYGRGQVLQKLNTAVNDPSGNNALLWSWLVTEKAYDVHERFGVDGVNDGIEGGFTIATQAQLLSLISDAKSAAAQYVSPGAYLMGMFGIPAGAVRGGGTVWTSTPDPHQAKDSLLGYLVSPVGAIPLNVNPGPYRKVAVQVLLPDTDPNFVGTAYSTDLLCGGHIDMALRWIRGLCKTSVSGIAHGKESHAVLMVRKLRGIESYY